MASIWKDSRTKNWVACFTDINGRRLKKTTKTTDRKKAQKIADSYELAATKKQTIRSVRETVTTLARDIWGIDAPLTTIRQHIDTWLIEKKSGTAESTLEFYEQTTTKFIDFLGERADSPIEEIDRATVASFKTEMAKTLAPKTVNNKLNCLRMIFKAARRDGLISEDPAEFVKVIKNSHHSIRRPFTIEELKKVVASCDEEWKSMVMCGLYTGQRLADIATLKWEQVDLGKREIRLVARKTSKLLRIPIAPSLQTHLETIGPAAKRHGPVHPRSCEIVLREKRSSSLSNQFSAILVAAGLRDAASLTKKSTGKGRESMRKQNDITFHSLRHTAVTMLKEAGVPGAVVMELIGHDSAAMSQHYTHVGSKALEEAAAKMPALDLAAR